MSVLVDDHLLSAFLRGRWRPDDASVGTTGCWYVRLCTALARDRGGSLSAPLRSLPAPLREAALRKIMLLPSGVTVLSLRDLAPLMGQLATRHQLNLLSREALASAIVLGAPVLMASGNENRSLAAALEVEGVRSAVVSPG